MIELNRDWEFTEQWSDAFMRGEALAESGPNAVVPVELPHTCKELPLHYIDEQSYQMICGYRRMLELPESAKDQRIFLQFDGAAHIATVFVNGVEAGTHRCGYTAFRVEITNLVQFDTPNIVSVKLDTTENPDVRPFGFVIDYLTYGGLYREAWLDIRPRLLVEDIFVYTPTLNTANIKVTLEGADASVASVSTYIFDAEGDEIWSLELDFKTFENGAQIENGTVIKASEALPTDTSSVQVTGHPTGQPTAKATGQATAKATGQATANKLSREDRISRTFVADISQATPWNLESPYLHTCAVALKDKNGAVLDWYDAQFGVRTAEFKSDGFYLNGEKTFLRGLNRHQSYPYIGYAAPRSLQWDDALILKNELACTAVRTSHYPQSQHFLEACDHLGLLVFTEAPGWQHIGDAAWQDQAVENVREMVVQNRNHPSIILWGVRINESLDNDEFYQRTNAVAHKLDPSRATSGVRYFEKSHLLEDVYAYNDFSHDGTNAGIMPKKRVTPDMNKALLISESNGHMYPTKPFDTWAHRQEQAVRHAHVMNDAYQSGEHAGCFEWCLFDYPTHKDFGSGDRICYHGVLDAFRNPKLAASVYASQGTRQSASTHQSANPSTSNWVLEVGSTMDIGDYPGGQIGEVYVFTNAEEVELYKNDAFVTKLDSSSFKALPHAPLIVNDTIGELLQTQEGFEKPKADLLRACLLSARKHGLAGMPVADKMKMLYAMRRYGLSYDDGVALYGKYVGNWGGEATAWRFDAKVQGQVVRSVTCCPSAHIHLEVQTSHTTLQEKATYDMAAVRVRILDEHNNLAPYAQLPVTFTLEGCLELVGPQTVVAEGGSCGCYVRTLGVAGEATLTIVTGQGAQDAQGGQDAQGKQDAQDKQGKQGVQGKQGGQYQQCEPVAITFQVV